MDIKKLLRSFAYAWQGIKAVIKSEQNMKIHLFVSLVVIILGFVLSISANEWILCVLCIGTVSAAEMTNTAIESIVDKVSPEQHKLAGKSKDAAAGAVLTLAICSVIVGIIIFLPKIIELF